MWKVEIRALIPLCPRDECAREAGARQQVEGCLSYGCARGSCQPSVACGLKRSELPKHQVMQFEYLGDGASNRKCPDWVSGFRIGAARLSTFLAKDLRRLWGAHLEDFTEAIHSLRKLDSGSWSRQKAPVPQTPETRSQFLEAFRLTLNPKL